MSNTLTNDIPKILDMGLAVLRENAVMPKLVNRDYEGKAAQKGASIAIPLANEFAATAVTPGYTHTSAGVNDINPTVKNCVLDQWFESKFIMNDKDLREVQNGIVPRTVESAMAAIANKVDTSILGLYSKVGNAVGIAGTAPFGSGVGIADITAARQFLVANKMPMDGNVSMVLGAVAEANALGLDLFNDASKSGSTAGVTEGYIGRKFGMDFMVDQNVSDHVSTALTAGALTCNGAQTAGSSVISLAKATNAAPLVAGDLITIAGDTQTYAVQEDVSLIVGNTNVSIFPALKKTTGAASVVTLKASSTSNLCFHRDAFVLASRPKADVYQGGNISYVTDPVTGLTIQLEVTRLANQTQWSFSTLFGVTELRNELAVRVLG